MSTITARDIATELVLRAARDVDALTISERLDETSDPDEADSIVDEITELIRTADITVGWPDGGSSAELDLDAIEARTPAVYGGPWYVQPAEDGRWLVGYPTDNPKAGLIATVPDYGEQLAEFIAAAREDVPALVAEVRRLRAELEARTFDARAAARRRWSALTPAERTAATASARAAGRQVLAERWEKQVDPDGSLDPAERAKRVAEAKHAHYVAMGRKSGESRRAKAAEPR